MVTWSQWFASVLSILKHALVTRLTAYHERTNRLSSRCRDATRRPNRRAVFLSSTFNVKRTLNRRDVPVPKLGRETVRRLLRDPVHGLLLVTLGHRTTFNCADLPWPPG